LPIAPRMEYRLQIQVMGAGTTIYQDRVYGPQDLPLLVGRLPDCGLQILSPHISRRHALFQTREPGELEVVDLGGVNGIAIGERVLRPGVPFLLPTPFFRFEVGRHSEKCISIQGWYELQAPAVDPLSISGERPTRETMREGVR
jgi:hypothetical protein